MSEQNYVGKVERVWDLTPTILSIQCSTRPSMSFDAGQYVMLGFPITQENIAEDLPRWPIALASGPSSPYLEFCIRKQSDHLLSPHLEKLKPGSLLELNGPHDNFAYDNPTNKPVVFVATGTGIAPFRSIMQSDEYLAQDPTTTVLIGAQTEAEIPYWKEWQESSMEVIPVLSQAGNQWTGHRGWVTDFMEQAPPTWYSSDALYFLCGQSEMLTLAKEQLQQHNIPSASIISSY